MIYVNGGQSANWADKRISIFFRKGIVSILSSEKHHNSQECFSRKKAGQKTEHLDRNNICLPETVFLNFPSNPFIEPDANAKNSIYDFHSLHYQQKEQEAE